MLGPELINLTVRPTPIFLEGVASLRISEPGPRELGLTDFQVVKGLVSTERGQLLLNLNGVTQTIIAPEYFRRFLGQNLFFQVQITADGATVLRPGAKPMLQDPGKPTATSTITQGISISGTPSSLLQQILNPDVLRQLPPSMAFALAAFGINFSPSLSIEAQILRARELLQRAGILRLDTNVEGFSRDSTLPSILLRLLGMVGVSQSLKERARILLGEIDARQDRLATGIRSDVINAEILTWVNGAPVEMSLQRGQRGNPPTRQTWILNLYTKFGEGSDAWVRIEHLPAFKVRLDTWLTDQTLFNKARNSRAEFAAEISSFGLQLDHFAVFNQPRDESEDSQGDTKPVRLGEKLDRSA